MMDEFKGNIINIQDGPIEVAEDALEYLPPRSMGILGQWKRYSILKNKRHPDIQFRHFCLENDLNPKSRWGLPVPNLQAAYKSLGKYCKPQPQVDPILWKKANEFFLQHFGPYCQGSRVLSHEEALATLDLTTSAGFPFNLKYYDKRAWSQDPACMAHCKENWVKMTDENFFVIFINALKEEIRLREKIEENSIRTFTAFPADLSLNGNRLCHDMNQKFYDSHLKTCSVVGLNVFGGGWDRIYKRLKRWSACFGIDFSQFDSSLFQLIFAAILDFRISMLSPSDQTPENIARMKTLYRNIVWSVIITADGLLVWKTTGNPSGSINTIVDNCFANYLTLAYVFLCLVPREYQTYYHFNNFVVMVICGDDNTMSVADEILPCFNLRNIEKEYAKINMKITSDSYDPRDLKECDFLSRKFNVFMKDRHGLDVCVPTLEAEKMVESLKYSENPSDPVSSLVRAIGIYQVTWADEDMRSFMKTYIGYLIQKYGPLLETDKDWCDALSGLKTDAWMADFYCYPRVKYLPESSSKVQERLRSRGKMDIKVENRRTRRTRRPKNNKKVKKEVKKEVKKDVKREVKKDVKKEVKQMNKKFASMKVNTTHRKGKLRGAPEQAMLRRVLETLVDPINGQPLRIGGTNGGERTAAAIPFFKPKADFSGTIEEGFSTAALIRRSALCNVIYQYTLAEGVSFSYASTQEILVNKEEYTHFTAPILPVGGGNITPHGRVLYPGRLGSSDPERGYWCEGIQSTGGAGAVTTGVDVAIPPAQIPSGGLNVLLKKLVGKTWVVEQFQPMSAAVPAITFLISSSGYYSVSLKDLTGTSTAPIGLDVTLKIGTTNAAGSGISPVLHAQLTTPNLFENITRCQNMTVLASSIEFSNTANLLSKGGTIVMASLKPQTYWYDQLSFEALSKARQSDQRPVEKGASSYLKPDSITSFDFLDEWVPTGEVNTLNEEGGTDNNVSDAAFLIYPRDAYKACVIDMPPGTTNSPSGYWTFASALEWVTNDQMTNLEFATVPRRVWEDAVNILSCAPEYFDNPDHIAELWEWVKGAARDVANGFVKYAPIVGEALMTAAPLVAML